MQNYIEKCCRRQIQFKFFGIKSNKPKIDSRKTEPKQSSYDFNMVSNFYKPKYQK